MRVAVFLPILLAGCVSNLSAEGTPYFALMTASDERYAGSTATYFEGGEVLFVEEPHPENNGRASQSTGTAPGSYEAGLDAMSSPTATERASAGVANQLPQPHDAPFEQCAHFDGAQLQAVPLYVCRAAAAHWALQ